MGDQVLGIDPGPTTGIALLARNGVPLVIQCNATAAWGVVAWLAADPMLDLPLWGGIEAFAPGRGAGARDTGAAVTRGLISELTQMTTGPLSRVVWQHRNAAAVKPWATDTRLAKAGLTGPTVGMPHARDACRHALYCAVHDLGWPDPLSRKYTS